MKKILSHTFNNTTGNTRLKYVVRYMAFSCFEEKKKKEIINDGKITSNCSQ